MVKGIPVKSLEASCERVRVIKRFPRDSSNTKKESGLKSIRSNFLGKYVVISCLDTIIHLIHLRCSYHLSSKEFEVDAKRMVKSAPQCPNAVVHGWAGTWLWRVNVCFFLEKKT
ncbi:hypothetical protein Mapa_016087 [Marchantia paleacea]|nr:hypothetical protein Mapa_016087 [Marchantia paleacea]